MQPETERWTTSVAEMVVVSPQQLIGCPTKSNCYCVLHDVRRGQRKVSDRNQPPMTLALSSELNGWLRFAAPSGSPFLVWPSSWIWPGPACRSPPPPPG